MEVALAFTANQTMFNVTLEIVGDGVVERDEVVVAELMVPEGESGVSLKSRHVNVSIIDDDSTYIVYMHVRYMYLMDSEVVKFLFLTIHTITILVL